MTILLLALSGAFFIGVSNVLTKKALDFTSRGQVILVSLFTATLIFLTANIFLGNIPLFFAPGALLFLLAGLLGPGIARTFGVISMKRIGVSRTTPIGGIAPFFAIVLAILFLGEEYSFYIFLGMALIIVGIFILTRRKENGKRVFDKKDLLIPLGAALFGGASIAITKAALTILSDPIVGATITLSAALFVVVGYMLGTKRIRNVHFTRKENVFPILGGCATACAFFLHLNALQIGDVSLVAPMLSTFPLFGVFLSHFFLKEEITRRTWLATAIIVSGVAIIQVF